MMDTVDPYSIGALWISPYAFRDRLIYSDHLKLWVGLLTPVVEHRLMDDRRGTLKNRTTVLGTNNISIGAQYY